MWYQFSLRVGVTVFVVCDNDINDKRRLSVIDIIT
jgi:hypothetical protein